MLQEQGSLFGSGIIADVLELAQCKAQAVALSGIQLERFMFCFFLGPLASSRVRGFSFYIKLGGANQIKSNQSLVQGPHRAVIA